MLAPLKKIDSQEFTWKEIEAARRDNRLLAFELELSNFCSFHCMYCYRNAGKRLPNELTLDELLDVSRQAIELGAKRVFIVGAGEPTLDPNLVPMLEFLSQRLDSVYIFTNGTGLSPGLARRLLVLKTGVMLKVDSLNPDVYDTLAGKKGAYKLAMDGLKNLRDAGYSPAQIIIKIVITKLNLKDLPQLLRWCRDTGYGMLMQRLSPEGRALESDISVEPSRLFELFKELKDIDERCYKTTWEIQPPWISIPCLKHYYSVMVDIQGNVMPCPGLNIIIGNTREKKLAEILNSSPVIRDLRHIDKTIKGQCADCRRKPGCYGCRGVAYHLTGDYLAEDPLCWHSHSALKNL